LGHRGLRLGRLPGQSAGRVAQAVEYLAGLGHRRIAYVDGGRGAISAGRRRGYQRAIRRQGLGEHLRVVCGDHTEESGLRAARTLVQADPAPTAVLTFNDRSAVGLLDARVRAGVDVPGDVSVVGYDDSPLSRLARIDLTTVSRRSTPLPDAKHDRGVSVGGSPSDCLPIAFAH
jgi:DNA-binding LacI/PurR family transcriptional regulator